MTGYTIRRVLAVIPVMLVVSLVVFGLVRFAPGDPAAIIAGPHASPANVEAIRTEMGLDRPLAAQLVTWYGEILRGDLGTSLFGGGASVWELIQQRLMPTFALSVLANVFAVVLALPLGVLAAWRANTWVDRSVMVFSTLGFSIPLFWLAFMMMIAFAVKLPLFPVAGYVPPGENIGEFFHLMALPVISTGIVVMSLIARMTRATVLETLSEDYIRTARAKGLVESTILIRHALRNAVLPIVTVVGLGFGLLLGGVVVTENVFAIPGMGRLVVDAISHRDYPVIQGTILLLSAVYALVNLMVDLSYAFIDPRIRYSGG